MEGILGVMSAAALVTATLQALVSDAGGKLRLAGFVKFRGFSHPYSFFISE